VRTENPSRTSQNTVLDADELQGKNSDTETKVEIYEGPQLGIQLTPVDN